MTTIKAMYYCTITTTHPSTYHKDYLVRGWGEGWEANMFPRQLGTTLRLKANAK